MISDYTFAMGIDLLQRHYKQNMEKDVLAIWRRYLDKELDDDQFAASVDKSILSSPFMPVPEKLVEFANGSLRAKAMEEWRSRVLRWAGSSIENQEKIWPSFSSRCRAALQLVGGFQAVGIAEYGELRKLEEQFITAYCECSPNAKALPPAKIPPMTFEGVEEKPQSNFDRNNKSEPLKRVFKTLEDRIKGERLSDQQAALNMFVLRWRWQIDEGRLEHYLALGQPEKIQFHAKFGYAMRNSPGWKSASTHFDCITNYTSPKPKVDSRAIAKEWLQN